MGIRGLTSFIEQHSKSCMEKYELHDTNLVIDGDSTAYQLYVQYLHPKHCCFTGDYDRYGNLIKNFFEILCECHIKPIFIFDGGYDDRKMDTIKKRMKERINIAGTLDGTSKKELFPLFLGELFKDLAIKFNFSVIRCDYEGDSESANIAKELGCPVLSSDSDFYIFDVMYIPFSSLKIQSNKKMSHDQTKNYSYITCQVFNTDALCKTIKLTKDKLPLLATLMGNDYFVPKYLNRLLPARPNVKRNYDESNRFTYIEKIITFIRHESISTVIEKLLKYYQEPSERDATLEIIHETLDGYVCKKSKYSVYLTGDTKPFESDEHINFIADKHNLDKQFFQTFLNCARRCMYPSCFMNILIQNKYYIRPQVEDHSLPSSHTISIEIISVINQILKKSKNLKFVTRTKNDLDAQIIPMCPLKLPDYLEIQEMSYANRQKLFLNILNITEKVSYDCIDHYPNQWKLYIITILYLCNKSSLNWSFIYSIVICKIILQYIDEKIGYFRKSQHFNEKFKQEICKILINRNETDTKPQVEKSISANIENISKEDCLIAQKNLMTFFEMKSNLRKDPKSFNRKIVHAAAQFQSCFYHIGFLNSLLKQPYENCPISSYFNGTFIYNFTADLRKNVDEEYVSFLLQNAPSVLACFNSIISNLKQHVNVPFLPTNEGFNV